MNIARYLSVLRLPRVRPVMVLMLLARIPTTAAGMTLTLHVVLSLDKGYGAAGLVGTAGTIGIALGAPLMGRLTDRRGLRAMLVLSTITEGLFWFSAPVLPYPVLLVTSLLSGLVTIPTMSIGRQVLTALVPVDQRRTALAVDSMAVEVAYMAGPALGVLLTTRATSQVALWSVGAAMVASGIALYVVNPPIRNEEENAVVERPARREWLTPPVLGVLLTSAGAIIVLAGMEVALVAALQEQGRVEWTGVLVIVMCAASLVGGFVYGAVSRPPSPRMLMTALGALAIPVGLSTGSVWVLALALVPANLMAAPVIASTGEVITRLTPASVRGEAMGLQGSAFTLGAAAGAPLAGFVIDHSSAGWGFVVVGAVGVSIAGIGVLLDRRAANLVEV
ncbi:MFS transporter [Umezawaea tangerina]|uniref:Putative MFS family arabinose efflux permease n=1 Tax=Umezawaea tangerina TaxID=84725 RepID=A0A2T0TKE4_9PSEU|nr:MFS transporter [Umezawaea tangerina]PRY46146.1 putative MFS family arabinose efflux permease [Umezawaea tangerina]